MYSIKIISVFLIVLLVSACSGQRESMDESIDIVNLEDEKIYYAIEIDGNLCGYMEVSNQVISDGDQKVISQKFNTFMMPLNFRDEFYSEVSSVALIDPKISKCSSFKVSSKEGSITRNSSIEVVENKAIVHSFFGNTIKEIPITQDVLFGGDEVYRRINYDFCERGLTESVYQILEVMDEEIQISKFKKTGSEDIEINGKKRHATIIEQLNRRTGIKTTYKLVPNLPHFAVMEVNNRKIYLTDKNVVDRVKFLGNEN